MKNVEDVNCTASFPVVSVCIEVMAGLHFNFLWRTCFRQVLGLLFIFSSKLLFFSFYCKGKREKRGNHVLWLPCSLSPFFSSSTCRLVWVGATHRVVMVTFQAHLRLLSVSPCTFPTETIHGTLEKIIRNWEKSLRSPPSSHIVRENPLRTS